MNKTMKLTSALKEDLHNIKSHIISHQVIDDYYQDLNDIGIEPSQQYNWVIDHNVVGTKGDLADTEGLSPKVYQQVDSIGYPTYKDPFNDYLVTAEPSGTLRKPTAHELHVVAKSLISQL